MDDIYKYNQALQEASSRSNYANELKSELQNKFNEKATELKEKITAGTEPIAIAMAHKGAAQLAKNLIPKTVQTIKNLTSGNLQGGAVDTVKSTLGNVVSKNNSVDDIGDDDYYRLPAAQNSNPFTSSGQNAEGDPDETSLQEPRTLSQDGSDAVENVGTDVVENTAEDGVVGGLAEGESVLTTSAIAEGGFNPVADIASLGLGLVLGFASIFGVKKHEAVNNMTPLNPSTQFGV